MVEWHGREHWCLSIDADECLVYPDCETVSLPRLCEYLDRVQADGMFSIMLDMYSDRPIADTHYERGIISWPPVPFSTAIITSAVGCGVFRRMNSSAARACVAFTQSSQRPGRSAGFTENRAFDA